MRTLKARFIAALGAAAMIASVPLTSMASWGQPDKADVTYALSHITAEVSDLVSIGTISLDDIKIVYLEDVLNDAELVSVKNTLNRPTVALQLLVLRNTLNHINVLNGNEILTFGDVLSNDDVDLDVIVGLNVFDDGKVLAWGCKTCH